MAGRTRPAQARPAAEHARAAHGAAHLATSGMLHARARSSACPARRPPGDGGVPPRPPPFTPRLRAGRRRRLVPQNTPAPPLAPISQLAWPPGAMPHACRVPPRVGHAPRLPPPAGILKAQMRTRGPARRDTLIYTPRAGLVDGAAFPGDALISCQLTLYFFYHVP